MKFKKGDRVLVKDAEGTVWEHAVFLFEEKDLRYPYMVEVIHQGEKVTIPFEQCKLDASYSKRQSRWLNDNNLTVGSKVLVARRFHTREDGSDCEGIDSFVGKAETLGKELVIKEIEENHLTLWHSMDGTTSGNYYPYTALEPVAVHVPVVEFDTMVKRLNSIGIYPTNMTMGYSMDGVNTVELKGFIE